MFLIDCLGCGAVGTVEVDFTDCNAENRIVGFCDQCRAVHAIKRLEFKVVVRPEGDVQKSRYSLKLKCSPGDHRYDEHLHCYSCREPHPDFSL